MFEDKNPQRTPISELGEFGLIDHLTKHVKLANSSTLKGIGDDAAVTVVADGMELLGMGLYYESMDTIQD